MNRGVTLALMTLAALFELLPSQAHAKKMKPAPAAEQCFLFFCDHAKVTRTGKVTVSTKRSVGISGVVAPLAAKAREISASCGSRVVSGVRHTYIAGTRRISLHASGQAVDMVGNPKCIYAHLRDWPGGYSTDYRRARHVHISWTGGGREWGARFAHGHHHRKVRHAKRPHRRHVAHRAVSAF